jgi:hypothetical protein
MPAIPSVQIRQQYARVGVETEWGKLEIRQQPEGKLELKTTPPKLLIESPPGELVIDQTRARDALGIGPGFMDRVTEEAKSLALQGIGRIVDAGNRMAAIHKKGNVIADMAWESGMEDFKINYEGPFSDDSVDIQYTPHRPMIDYTPGSTQITPVLNPPEINVSPTKVNLYLEQKPGLEFIPPQIDLKV